MRKILSIDINEKNRILEMHRSAIRKTFLIEQAQDDEEGDMFGGGGNTTSAKTQTTTTPPAKKPEQGVPSDEDLKKYGTSTNPPAKKETDLQKTRKTRIYQLIQKQPKYGFIEVGGFLNRKQNLDVQITKISMTSDNGQDSVFINGRIGEQQESEDSPYIGDIVFLYRCKDGLFELYKEPQQNPQYQGVTDDETEATVKGTNKSSKLKRTKKGDKYNNGALSKWLRNNLFLCGTKFQPIAQ